MNEKESKISEGDICVIRRDISVGGQVAFRQGDRVTVEKIDPRPGRPDFKYVVRSSLLDKRFQLSDSDLSRVDESAAVSGVASPAAGAAKKKAHRRSGRRASRFSWKAATLAVFIVALAVGLVVTLSLTVWHESAREKIDRLDNQRWVIHDNANATTMDLAAEIKKAMEQAPTPEAFKPLGEKIAENYIKRYRRYYRQMSEVCKELRHIDPPEELKGKFDAMTDSCEIEKQAMLAYTTALDHVRRGEINEAVRAINDANILLNGGQPQDGPGGAGSVPAP